MTTAKIGKVQESPKMTQKQLSLMFNIGVLGVKRDNNQQLSLTWKRY